MAVPGVSRARQYANSGSAIQSLRTITSAEYMYERTHNAFATLNALYSEALVHGDLGEGYKSGYTFEILVGLLPRLSRARRRQIASPAYSITSLSMRLE